MSIRTCFTLKVLSKEEKRHLGFLSSYIAAAGVKPSEIPNEKAFWEIVEKIYEIKILVFPSPGNMIISASNMIANLSRTVRRNCQKQYRGSPQKLTRQRIMKKLEKENELFHAGMRRERTPSQAEKTEFYLSWEWQTLRKKVLNEFGPRCQCCGATRDHLDMAGRPVRIVVDHIKPLHNFWSLRLERSNLQVLCDECNKGKGAWDETDHR